MIEFKQQHFSPIYKVKFLSRQRAAYYVNFQTLAREIVVITLRLSLSQSFQSSSFSPAVDQ